MTGVVLDASALLAFLLAEPGADVVTPLLRRASLSAVNYAEVLAKVVDRGRPPESAVADIDRLQLAVIAFDASQAAALRTGTRSRGLSLADRACLALARTLDLPAVTADRAWADCDTGVRLILIR